LRWLLGEEYLLLRWRLALMRRKQLPRLDEAEMRETIRSRNPPAGSEILVVVLCPPAAAAAAAAAVAGIGDSCSSGCSDSWIHSDPLFPKP